MHGCLMSAGPIELDAAADFLASRYGGNAAEVAHLGGGDWSRAFSFRLDGRDLVARFGLHVEDFTKDQKAMAFAGPDLPVPAVLEIGEALGGHYAISERHFGTFLEELDEDGWRNVMPPLLRALDAMREVTPPAAAVDWAFGDPGMSWRQWLVESLEDRPGRRTSGRGAAINAAPEVSSVYLAAEQAMRSLVDACPELRHVMHRDLLNRNVLVADDGTGLEAVFDWGCSLAGDFLYEVALLSFFSPWFPALARIDVPRAVADHCDLVGLRVEDFEPRLACYELHVGLEHIPYAVFTNRPDHLRAITRRTAEILERRSSDRIPTNKGEPRP